MSDMLYPRNCMVGFYYANPCFIRDKKKYQQFQKENKNGFVTEHEIKKNIR
jgi:hypothetical protein